MSNVKVSAEKLKEYLQILESIDRSDNDSDFLTYAQCTGLGDIIDDLKALLPQDTPWIVNTGVEPTDGDAKVEVMFASGGCDTGIASEWCWTLGHESWRIVQYRFI